MTATQRTPGLTPAPMSVAEAHAAFVELKQEIGSKAEIHIT